jgi:hypothetical protein
VKESPITKEEQVYKHKHRRDKERRLESSKES